LHQVDAITTDIRKHFRSTVHLDRSNHHQSDGTQESSFEIPHDTNPLRRTQFRQRTLLLPNAYQELTISDFN
jgi:hypothetical protein